MSVGLSESVLTPSVEAVCKAGCRPGLGAIPGAAGCLAGTGPASRGCACRRSAERDAVDAESSGVSGDAGQGVVEAGGVVDSRAVGLLRVGSQSWVLAIAEVELAQFMVADAFASSEHRVLELYLLIQARPKVA